MQARGRRFDPQRRARILAAALDVIAQKGVEGASMRGIAEAADVPLGSITYHFTDREALLQEAFELFLAETAPMIVGALEAAATPSEMLDAVADLACGETWGSRKNLLLSYELYAWASRRPECSEVVERCLNGTRRALTRFFTKAEADAIDALFDGAAIHRAYDSTPPSREELRVMLGRIGGE